MDLRPYDALLLLSFGGPEKPEDVVPFLANVTRGRGIPEERLAQVGQHYFGFGGKSPINDQNRALLAAIRADFDAQGIDLPVYWGNRNWAPYLDDVAVTMAEEGHRRIAVIATSAYSSYSSCRQYRENLFDAASAITIHTGATVVFDKIRPYFNAPGFVAPIVDGIVESLETIDPELRSEAPLLFVTHSIPESMNDASGIPEVTGAYVAQHEDLAAVVAAQVADRTGAARSHELVFCSKSGDGRIPWLEPDINDRLEELAADGAKAVVMIPIGFVSDHMEVVYDLDTEAQATCERLGLVGRRSATAGTDPRFVAALRDLVVERAARERGDSAELGTVVGSFGPVPDRCAVNCCAGRVAKPALCGVDQ